MRVKIFENLIASGNGRDINKWLSEHEPDFEVKFVTQSTDRAGKTIISIFYDKKAKFEYDTKYLR